MLDISRIQTGTLPMHAGLVDVGSLIESSVRLSREFLAARRGSELQFVAPAQILVRGDVGRLTQVMTSLLANALRFGDGRPVQVEAQADSETVTISVRDEGRGVAADKREKIFERYASAISPAEGGGLGLGLFIARQIVTSHGGQIWVESEPGRGATFYVRLPRAD
jgi:signal transduction histidine kinase